jgi:hypothetical protein
MGMGFLLGKMVISMLENLKMTKGMVKEFILGLVDKNSLVFGKMITKMVKVIIM